MKRLLLAATLVATLTGCGHQMPPMNFSVPNVGPSMTKIDAEVKSLTVTMGRPDEVAGSLPAGAENLAPLWRTSLEEALNKMAIFKDDAPRKVSLAVKVLKIDIPPVGFTFETATTARYELIDRATGAVIFTTDINSTGATPMDHAFVATTRQRESLNRSVQNNILQFLQQLETVNVTRPMFPSQRKATS